VMRSRARALSDADKTVRSQTLLELNGIEKRFGFCPVLKGLTISCVPGEIMIMLGANGAGKSTLLRIVAGLLRADRGTVRLAPSARIGFVGHHTGLYPRLSLISNLKLYAELAGIGSEQLSQFINDWRLNEFRDKTLSDLSRGAQSKAALIRALILHPEVLVLDEPSSNLDEVATDLLKGALVKHATLGGVAIVATHDLARLGELASRVVVLEEGRILADSGGSCGAGEKANLFELYRSRNR